MSLESGPEELVSQSGQKWNSARDSRRFQLIAKIFLGTAARV